MNLKPVYNPVIRKLNFKLLFGQLSTVAKPLTFQNQFCFTIKPLETLKLMKRKDNLEKELVHSISKEGRQEGNNSKNNGVYYEICQFFLLNVCFVFISDCLG